MVVSLKTKEKDAVCFYFANNSSGGFHMIVSRSFYIILYLSSSVRNKKNKVQLKVFPSPVIEEIFCFKSMFKMSLGSRFRIINQLVIVSVVYFVCFT